MRYSTLAEFYPFYLTQHMNPVCRHLHVIGTSGVIALVLSAALTADPWLLLAVPFAGYGFAWCGHFFFEHNKPATFKQPIFSLISDFLMFRDVLLRRLPKPAEHDSGSFGMK
jgi:hypothetical protein